MKIILTGSSGFIGAEVLRQCIQHPSITSIIALSRRDLSITHPKLKTVLMPDFEVYEPSVMEALEGADGCIWALGVKTTDIAIQKKVTIDYTLAALHAFSRIKSSNPTSPTTTSPKPFTFIFTSGILAAPARSPASQSLWFGSGARRIKGSAEDEVLNFSSSPAAAASTTTTDTDNRPFQPFITRPGAVLDVENSSLGAVLAGVAGGLGAPAVSVQALAAVMVDLAVNGGGDGSGSKRDGVVEGGRVWENRGLVGRGRELLAGGKGAKGKAEGKKGREV